MEKIFIWYKVIHVIEISQNVDSSSSEVEKGIYMVEGVFPKVRIHNKGAVVLCEISKLALKESSKNPLVTRSHVISPEVGNMKFPGSGKRYISGRLFPKVRIHNIGPVVLCGKSKIFLIREL